MFITLHLAGIFYIKEFVRVILLPLVYVARKMDKGNVFSIGRQKSKTFE